MKIFSGKESILSDLSENAEQEHWGAPAYSISATRTAATNFTIPLPSRRENGAGDPVPSTSPPAGFSGTDEISSDIAEGNAERDKYVSAPYAATPLALADIGQLPSVMAGDPGVSRSAFVGAPTNAAAVVQATRR
jgi:hypothetical protein